MAQSVPAADAEPRAKHTRLAWRTWVPWTLLVIAAVIGLVSALNIWVKRQALSTDNWTKASSQLLQDEKIRSALSIYLVNQIYENVDVAQALEQRLPPRAKGLAKPLAAGLEGTAVNAVDALLARPRVQKLWKEANRRAHELFMAVLNGKKNILVQSGGNVVLDLRPILLQLGERTGLGGRLEGRLPPDAGQIVIMKGNQLGTTRPSLPFLPFLPSFLFFLFLSLSSFSSSLPRDRPVRGRNLARARAAQNAAAGNGYQRRRRGPDRARGAPVCGRLPRQCAHDQRRRQGCGEQVVGDRHATPA